MSLCSLNITIGIFIDKFVSNLLINVTEKNVGGFFGENFMDILVYRNERLFILDLQ